MTGEEFKQIRMKLGFDQTEMARILFLSGQVAISHIETEFRNPSKLTVAIMNLFNELPERKVKELISLLKEQSLSRKKKSQGGPSGKK